MSKNKMYFYPALFYSEEDGYSVIFPDFEYIATQGNTQVEAYEKAVEVLGIGIEDALKGDIDLPTPSEVKHMDSDGDATIVIVSVNMSEWLAKYSTKTVRRNITLPESLDSALRRGKVNVSRICQEALLRSVK